MQSRFSFVAAVAVAACTIASSAQTQTPTGAQVPDIMISQPVDSLATWDRQVGMLTQMAWNVSAMSDTIGSDHAGHTLESYWNDNVLTVEPKRRLDELHAKAVAQTQGGDSEGLTRTLAEAEPLIRAELYKSFVVMGYWAMEDNVAYQMKLLQPWLDRASPEERKTVSDRVEGTYEALKKSYAAALESKEYSVASGPASGLVTTMDGASRFLDEERISLVKQQESLPIPFNVAPLKREQPCTLSIAPKLGASKASIAVSEFPPSEQYYPAEMKRRGVSGNVIVNVEVSTLGCAETAKIVGSSGVKELDEAGLKYAMDGHFVPAAEADKAVPGSIVFRIAFSLRP